MDLLATESNFREYSCQLFKDADSYCRLSINAIKKGKFTPQLIHNFMCISVEKFLMACLVLQGNQPGDHNLIGLVDEIKYADKKPHPMLHRMVEFLDSFMDLCSLEIQQEKPISEDDMFKLQQCLLYVREFTELKLFGKETVVELL
jgi:hypothetical protein